jgi:hypothetical protein
MIEAVREPACAGCDREFVPGGVNKSGYCDDCEQAATEEAAENHAACAAEAEADERAAIC